MSDPVKLALVGCGGISGAHVRGYADLYERGCREFEVTACCDVNAASADGRAVEIAAFQGKRPQVYTEVEAMLEAGLAEAADLCLPHCFHHSVAIPLLNAGVHVLLEKPLGITVKASRRIIEAAQANGSVLATAENVRRYLPARACAWAINEWGLIGDVRLVDVQMIMHRPFDYTKAAAKWRGIKRLTGGGMIMDSGAHFADMVQVLFGEVDEVTCTMASYDDRLIEDAPVVGDAQADVEDTWHAVIRFVNGIHVTWTYSRSLYGEQVRLGNYYGSAGTMYDQGFVFHCFQGGGQAVLADGTQLSSQQIEQAYLDSLDETERQRLYPYGSTDGFAIEVLDFARAIRTGEGPEMDGEAGLRAKALCEACYESATIGSPVKYADVLRGTIDAYQEPIDAFWGI
jgi:UDP-N-acetyl-2-amino-2-deoxyglucuronate dehydrogenase